MSRPDPAPDDRVRLARALSNLGNVLRQGGRNDDAVAPTSEAVALAEALTGDYPGVLEYREELARSLYTLASLRYEQNGRAADGLDATERALRVLRRLAEDDPAPGRRRALADTLVLRAAILDSLKRKGAADDYREAVGIHADLAGRHPDQPEYRFRLGNTWSNLGVHLRDGGALADARPAFDSAVAELEAAAAADPRNAMVAGALFNALSGQADVLLRLGEYEAAARVADRLTADDRPTPRAS